MDRTSWGWKPECCFSKKTPTSPFANSVSLFSPEENEGCLLACGHLCHIFTRVLYSQLTSPLPSVHRTFQRPLFFSFPLTWLTKRKSPTAAPHYPLSADILHLGQTQCLSDLTVHDNHLGSLLNYGHQGPIASGLWFRRTELESDHLHFQRAPRECRCCLSLGQTLSSTSLVQNARSGSSRWKQC